jgi:hypothetical protein
VESVVVPTTLKIALNPNGYAINLRYVKVAADAGYDATTKYYELTSGKYVRKVFSGTTAATDFEAARDAGMVYVVGAGNQSNANIVSLNYGIVNKSTRDKVVRVKLAVTQNTSETNNKQAIEFKDTAEEAQTYDSTTEKGAAQDELAMYLAVASADGTTAPTANTYEKVTTYASGTVYYTRDAANKYSLATAASNDGKLTEDEFKAMTVPVYKESTTIGTEILASELSDITMDVAEDGVVGFKAGSENKANAEIGYKLGKAEYSLKDDADLDFGSTQQDLGDLLEMSAIGGVAGFTITGTMNTDADWTTADTVALKFVPTYHIKNATNDEEYVDDAKTNPLNQIKLVEDDVAPSIATASVTAASDTDAVWTYSLGSGTKKATGISSIKFGDTDVTSSFDIATAGSIKLDKTAVNAVLGTAASYEYTVVFDDTEETTGTITLVVNE